MTQRPKKCERTGGRNAGVALNTSQDIGIVLHAKQFGSTPTLAIKHKQTQVDTKSTTQIELAFDGRAR